MQFEILEEISEVETFAAGARIQEVARLRKAYGRGRSRKRKGIARVRLADDSVQSGIGRKEFKIKRLL
jgi:hypothetical protein